MLNFDWKSYYNTLGEISAALNVEATGEGWYTTQTDTLLVLESQSSGTLLGARSKYYEVYCWNHPGAREEILNEYARQASLPHVSAK